MTRELPDHYPFVVANEYITSIIGEWESPAVRLYDAVYHSLLQKVKALTEKHFGKFAQGGLHARVKCVHCRMVTITSVSSCLSVLAMDYMKKCGDETRYSISWLLNLERRPRTLNDHYYSDYRDKFLAHYKGNRYSGKHGSLIRRLEAHDSSPTSSSIGSQKQSRFPDFAESTAKVLSGLQEIGISSKATDLPKLLPSDPYEPALHIMATVRAYFQGALSPPPLPLPSLICPPYSGIQTLRGQHPERNRPRARAWPRTRPRTRDRAAAGARHHRPGRLRAMQGIPAGASAGRRQARGAAEAVGEAGLGEEGADGLVDVMCVKGHREFWLLEFVHAHMEIGGEWNDGSVLDC